MLLRKLQDVFYKLQEGPECLLYKKKSQHSQQQNNNNQTIAIFTKARFVWTMTHLVILRILLDINRLFPTDIERKLYLLMVIMNALLYFIVSFSDPGYVRPAIGAFFVVNDYDNQRPKKKWNLMSNSSSLAVGEVFNSSSEVRECVHCDNNVYQPIRAKHCFACNRCVRKFDHHCHWISNCVGEKNHGKFLMFLFSQFVVVLWAFFAVTRTFDVGHGDSSRNSRGKTVEEIFSSANAKSLLLLILFFVFSLFVGSLLVTHIFLVLTARTTYELLRSNKIWYLPKRSKTTTTTTTTTMTTDSSSSPSGNNSNNNATNVGMLEFTRSPFSSGNGFHGCFANCKRTLCLDASIASESGVKWHVPSESILLERELEETVFENRSYSCC